MSKFIEVHSAVSGKAYLINIDAIETINEGRDGGARIFVRDPDPESSGHVVKQTYKVIAKMICDAGCTMVTT